LKSKDWFFGEEKDYSDYGKSNKKYWNFSVGFDRSLFLYKRSGRAKCSNVKKNS
jgi:hypothetical protein